MKNIPESRYLRWIQKKGYGKTKKQTIEEENLLTIPKSKNKKLLVPIGGPIEIQENGKSKKEIKFFYSIPKNTTIDIFSHENRTIFLSDKIRFDETDHNFEIQKNELFESVKNIREGFLGWAEPETDSTWGLLEINNDLSSYFYSPYSSEILITQRKIINVSLLFEFNETKCVQLEGIIKKVNYQIPDWVSEHPFYRNKIIKVFYFTPTWIRKTDVSTSPWDTVELIMSSPT